MILKAKALNNKALILQNIGKYPEALQMLFDAKKMMETETGVLQDSANIKDYLVVTSNIGIIFYNTEKYNEAITIFKNGLDYLNNFQRAQNSSELFLEYFRFNLNTGAVHAKVRDFEKAEFYFTKALQYLDEEDKTNYGVLLNNLSIVAREKGDIEKAFEMNLKAIEACRESDYFRGLSQGYNNLGNCYMYVGKFSEAKKNFMIAYDLADKYGFGHSAAISLDMLRRIYDTIGEHKKAYQTLMQFKTLSDSLLDLEKVQMVTQLEMQEKFDKRMSVARMQQKEIEIQQNQRELIYTLVIVFIAMGLVILILLFYLQQGKSKRHRIEAERNALLNKSLNLEKNTLKEELELKNKELATNVMYMIRKNELISQISEKLIKSKLTFKKENQKIIDEIIRELQSSTEDEIWKEFEIRFQQVHNEFYNTLNTKFPNLSANEKRLCAFLRLNMSTKEISAITYQSINSLTVARSRLRKKLDLDSDENLIAFLESI